MNKIRNTVLFLTINFCSGTFIFVANTKYLPVTLPIFNTFRNNDCQLAYFSVADSTSNVKHILYIYKISYVCVQMESKKCECVFSVLTFHINFSRYEKSYRQHKADTKKKENKYIPILKGIAHQKYSSNYSIQFLSNKIDTINDYFLSGRRFSLLL